MANGSDVTPIEQSWLRFVDAAVVVMGPHRGGRPLDQFLPFRDEVLVIVKSEAFLMGLRSAWPVYTNGHRIAVGSALLRELDAFPRAVEVVEKTVRRKRWQRWWDKLADKASTVAGSVDDVIDGLDPVTKAGIKLFREAVELLRDK